MARGPDHGHVHPTAGRPAASAGDAQRNGGAHGPDCALHTHAGGPPRDEVAGTGMRRLAGSLALTAGVMVAEAVGGWMSGSLALVSDAGHMLTDAGALGIALVAAYLASRRPDDKRTYGYRRAEVLAAQLNVAVLIGLSGWIGWEAVQRLRVPGPPIALGLMASVAALGLAANVAILWFLHDDRSLNARAAFLHVLSDTISSVAILLGAGAMALHPELLWIDPVLSIAIAGLILWGAGRLALEITDILMEGVPRHLDATEVCRLMEACEGVVAVHDLHIWTISSGLTALSAHLVVEANAMGRNDAILTLVKGGLSGSFGIDHTTLQIESSAYARSDEAHPH